MFYDIWNGIELKVLWDKMYFWGIGMCYEAWS